MRTRLERPDGDWVEFTTRPNYAMYRRVTRDGLNGSTEAELVAALVTNWSLRDDDGKAIPFPEVAVGGIPGDALDAIPLDTYVAMRNKANEIILGLELVPKAESATSSGTSREGS